MYQYTIYQLANINTYSDHTGLLLMLLVCIPLSGILYLIWDMLYEPPFLKYLFGSVIVSMLSITTFNSFKEGEIIVRENTPVTAKFIGYVAEGYRTTGKHAADVHKVYMEVEVENKRVLIATNSGVAIPAYMTLYRNAITKHDR